MKLFIRIGCVAALLYLQSCGGSAIKNKADQDQTSSTGSKSKIPVPAATDNLVINNQNDLIGYWVGEFGPEVTPGDSTSDDMGNGDDTFNKINISIDSINSSKVKGHTVIAGKVRFFNCNMVKAGSKYQFMFKGGADEKADGVYKFSIAEGDSLLKGNWDPGSDKIPSHSYSLTKKLFRYNPNWKIDAGQYVDWNKYKAIKVKEGDEDYNQTRFATTSEDLAKLNPSTDILTKEQVANLKKADLLVLRNSIFARHGYTFKKPLLSLLFSQQAWYVPISNDVTAELTDTEKKNIALMMPFEKNAQEYYNAYGR